MGRREGPVRTAGHEGDGAGRTACQRLTVTSQPVVLEAKGITTAD